MSPESCLVLILHYAKGARSNSEGDNEVKRLSGNIETSCLNFVGRCWLDRCIAEPLFRIRTKFLSSSSQTIKSNRELLIACPETQSYARHMSLGHACASEHFYVFPLFSVDLPPERRLKKWAISLHELISDAIGRQEFERYLKTEYSQENIRFWKACEELKFCPLSEVEKKIDAIFG